MAARYEDPPAISRTVIYPAQKPKALPVSLFPNATGANGTAPDQVLGLEAFFQYLQTDPALQSSSRQALDHLARTGKTDAFKKWRARQLPIFMAGQYRGRGDLAGYAQLQVFDIDGLDEVLVSFILEDCAKVPIILAAFPSPSLGGLRILVLTDSDPDTHKACYHAIAGELAAALELPLKTQLEADNVPHIDDKTTDALHHVWFCNHLPKELLYLNWQSEIFRQVDPEEIPTDQAERLPAKRPQGGAYKYEFSLQDKVEDMIRQIEAQRLDLTPGKTGNWFRIGCALVDGFGENGREYFHQVSQFHPGYDPQACDRQFAECRRKHNGRIRIDTFFKLYGDAGIKVDYGQLVADRRVVGAPMVEVAAVEDELEPEDPITDQVEAELEEEDPDESNFNNKARALEEALGRRWDFRFNVITRIPEFRIKDKGEFQRIDDYALNSITRQLRLVGTPYSTRTRIAETIESGYAPLVNPIEDYFLELQADGQDHIAALCKTVTTLEGQEDMFHKYLEKWLVGAVANAFTKNRCANHLCFILTGEQGTFKSTWIRKLCPPRLVNYYFEGNLDPESKDDLFATTANFIYNLDDYFAEVTKKKINSLKAFITKDTVNARRAYGRYPEELPKICSFIASANEDTFLHDPTGNRRFIPFEVTAVDIQGLEEVDIDQVWAQAHRLFREGFTYWLSREDQEDLKAHNSKYEVQSLEFDLVNTYFQPPAKRMEAEAYLTTADLIDRLALKSSIRLTPKKIGEAMKKAGFERFQKRLDGKLNPSWVYAVDHTERIDIEEEKTTGEGLSS